MKVQWQVKAAQENRVGCRNPWHRRPVLQKFDEWRYKEGEPPSWYLRYKENESRKIRTPDDFLRVLAGCMQFVVDQLKKDPNYQPPEKFLEAMRIVGPMIDQAMAERLKVASSP